MTFEPSPPICYTPVFLTLCPYSGTLPTLRKDRQLAHSPCTFPPAGGDNFLARHFQLNFPLHVLVVVVLTRDAIFFDHFAFHNRDMVHPDTLGIV
jgi:hypothetical protein